MSHRIPIPTPQYANLLKDLFRGLELNVHVVHRNETDRSNPKYGIHVTGPDWRKVIGALMKKRWSQKHPVEHRMDGSERWSGIFLKLQTSNFHPIEEDRCHAIVNRACPGISPRIIFGLTHGRVRITAMEWIENCTTLYEVLRDPTHFLDRIIARLPYRITAIVSHMWCRAGIAHGDLHEKNVLVSAQGSVYIVDFGFSVRLPHRMKNKLQ
ncbi:hypothetical protein TSOC_015160, partial [Tetrabaena socialis]